MDDIATIFRSKNALDCKILHMQSQLFFLGVILIHLGLRRSVPGAWTQTPIFRLAHQRSQFPFYETTTERHWSNSILFCHSLVKNENKKQGRI